MIEKKGGKQWFFNLYAQRNRQIRTGIQKLGLTMFPKYGYESPTVSCINSPEGIDAFAIYEGMRRKGYELAKGYGSIQNTTFRIGNMGYISSTDIDSMLKALETVLTDLGMKYQSI
jgi:aspartate aminotransferase-like enzyme